MAGKKKAAPQVANPQLRTVAQYRAAIKRLNEIANERADEHGLCHLWDEIVEDVARETGLELERRETLYAVHMEGFEVRNIISKDPPDERAVSDALEAAIVAIWPGAYITHSYVTTSEE